MKHKFSFLNLSNAGYIESLHEQYLKDPSSVEPSWRSFFEGLEFGMQTLKPEESQDIGQKVIHAYRKYGHLKATFNPLKIKSEPHPEQLDFSKYDQNQLVKTYGLMDSDEVCLKDLIATLERIYCAFIGFECSCSQYPEIEKWIYETIESHKISFSKQEKIDLLEALNQAEAFESFLHLRYQGKKRFSLEGAETLIPMLQYIIHASEEFEIKQIAMCMAHRGRLNVLANILQKPLPQIFCEFEPKFVPANKQMSGDVNYHKGFERKETLASGYQLDLYLAANPSHLESVNPVLQGVAKAMQDKLDLNEHPKTVLPITIHGDAAIAGQGVVYETLQAQNLGGYSTKGTLHIVINNNIGYTATPEETRSTRYCTDIAKAFSNPVIHVNAEDPESCLLATKLALQIRMQFGIDVFIDLNCYRKYGHNETDEPMFTNPREYQVIKEKTLIHELYKQDLYDAGIIDESEFEKLDQEFMRTLEAALSETKNIIENLKPEEMPFNDKSKIFHPCDTAVSIDKLKIITNSICTLPEGFNIHRKIKKQIDLHIEAIKNEKENLVDWALAEKLAYASLVYEGYSVRLTGEDSKRGTFSHRHATLFDQVSGLAYTPISNIVDARGKFWVYNDFLSEVGAMGIAYGYSTRNLDTLTIWEGQFGDFSNGAQVIIDQYIASGEEKWGQRSNLILFLPHGFEAMGPEHSSARIERFLQLCANYNMYLFFPTTPGQIFHLIRRQMKQNFRIPLILFSPKEMLRYKPSFSNLNELSSSNLKEVLDDPSKPEDASKVILCSGKVYYDLMIRKEKIQEKDVAIIRIEQLYPFHKEKLKHILENYKQAKTFMWVQEEHQNAGAWQYIYPLLQEVINKEIIYVGRAPSASTAPGTPALNELQKQEFLTKALPGQDSQ